MDLLAFKIVIEPDEDAWRSYYPAWEHLGAATGGETPEEAAAGIKEVLEMMVEEIERGEIEWPIEPCAPDWDFSKPSIQDAPESVQRKCAPEYPDAIAAHGGLPVLHSGSGAAHSDVYRLIYVALDDVMAAMYESDRLALTRTGGYVPNVFTPWYGNAPVSGERDPAASGEEIAPGRAPAAFVDG